MANKELTFWCKLKFVIGSKKSIYAEDCFSKFLEDWIVESSESYEDEIQIFYHYIEGTNIYFCTNYEESILVYSNDFEIVWHPVMIGDIIKRIKENREISYWEYLVKLLGQLSRPWLRRELGLSIDDQAQECIDYVYSLIQK